VIIKVKKKGFTLIEMMAVIAILGILVIMVVPNVLKSYRDSKKVAFIDEAKVVYTKATDAYVMGKTKGQKITYISNEVEDTTQLDLKAKEDLKYTVQLDRKTGEVTSFVLKNSEFCIVGIGDFLNDYTKEQVIDCRDTGSGVNQTAIDLCNSETYRPGTPLEVELVDKINDRVKTKAKPKDLLLKYNQGWYEKGTERSLSNGVGEDAIYKIDEIPTKINYYYKGSEVEGNDIKVIGCGLVEQKNELLFIGGKKGKNVLKTTFKFNFNNNTFYQCNFSYDINVYFKESPFVEIGENFYANLNENERSPLCFNIPESI
jgi:prepilin-type N-terminal cleavage/methylation domain-containing protein